MGKIFKYLNLEQRYNIEGMLIARIPINKIAKTIGVHQATVYREKNRAKYMHRNSDWTEEERYAPETAEKLYRDKLKEKGKDLKVGNDIKFLKFIENKIVNEKLSPTAALIKAEEKNFKTKICVTTLYSYIDKGIFLNLTNKDLSVKRNKRSYKKIRRIHKRKAAGDSIEKRPEDIDNRKEFGHWEMDTVVGKLGVSKKSFLVFTERKTRFEIVELLKKHTSKEVVNALNRIEKQIGTENFRRIFKTITVDNGTEFSDNDGLRKARRSNQSRTEIYYCHPFSSCERGTNENNNKLIRRHYPKGTNFDHLIRSQVRKLQDWINDYPRRMFNGKTSDKMFEGELNKINLKEKELRKLKSFFLSLAVP